MIVRRKYESERNHQQDSFGLWTSLPETTHDTEKEMFNGWEMDAMPNSTGTFQLPSGKSGKLT